MAENKSQSKDYKLKEVVSYVALSDKKEYKDRIYLYLNNEIDSTDDHGNEKKNNYFSLHSYNLFRQLTRLQFVGKAELVAFSNNGKYICIPALSMLLDGATIEGDRIWHLEGEEREIEGGVYNHDTYATKITKIDNSSISPMLYESAVKMIKEYYYDMMKASQVVMRPTI